MKTKHAIHLSVIIRLCWNYDESNSTCVIVKKDDKVSCELSVWGVVRGMVFDLMPDIQAAFGDDCLDQYAMQLAWGQIPCTGISSAIKLINDDGVEDVLAALYRAWPVPYKEMKLPELNKPEVWKQGTWISKATNKKVKTDTLRHAGNAGLIRKSKVNGRLEYEINSVFKYLNKEYPVYAHQLLNAYNEELAEVKASQSEQKRVKAER